MATALTLLIVPQGSRINPMRINIGDVRLYFDVEGAGLVPDGPSMAERPVLVALHGGPGADHSLFKPVLGRAAEFAQVVYLDQRGSGRSDAGDPASWTWERWADDVVDFCDALGIANPVLERVSRPVLIMNGADDPVATASAAGGGGAPRPPPPVGGGRPARGGARVFRGGAPRGKPKHGE
jgi:predicted alpha/beta-fold hydrolase